MPVLEDELKLSNWLSILTFDVVKYAAAGGEVIVEWTDEALVLHLPGVTADQVHGKFRRLVELAAAEQPETVAEEITP